MNLEIVAVRLMPIILYVMKTSISRRRCTTTVMMDLRSCKTLSLALDLSNRFVSGDAMM